MNRAYLLSAVFILTISALNAVQESPSSSSSKFRPIASEGKEEEVRKTPPSQEKTPPLSQPATPAITSPQASPPPSIRRTPSIGKMAPGRVIRKTPPPVRTIIQVSNLTENRIYPAAVYDAQMADGTVIIKRGETALFWGPKETEETKFIEPGATRQISLEDNFEFLQPDRYVTKAQLKISMDKCPTPTLPGQACSMPRRLEIDTQAMWYKDPTGKTGVVLYENKTPIAGKVAIVPQDAAVVYI